MFAEMSDAALVQCVAKGQHEAEAEVCRRLGPRIRLYGLRHLHSASAADDLVQHVLLKTLEALRAGRLREAVKRAPFVLGTCRMDGPGAPEQPATPGASPGGVWRRAHAGPG